MALLRETLQSLRRQIVGDPLPPEAVAGGWALGMFVGCAVPFGLQLMVSVPLALMLRVSKIGATVGTLITNPVTIFFIYPAQTMMMGWILRRPFTWAQISESMRDVAEKSNWASLFALSSEIIVCFLLGGLLLALVLSPLTYFIVHHVVAKYRSLVPQKRGGPQAAPDMV